MSIPYSSTANLPQGFETVTIDGVTYKLDGVSMPSKQNRIIERTDELGDRSDFAVDVGSERIVGTLTLQRATIATALPAEGVEFTLDFDRSGIPSVLVAQNVTVSRDKDAFDMFEVDMVKDRDFDAMVVEGAGTAVVNGTYLRDGDSGGKPRYTLVGGTTNDDSILGGGSGWFIFNDESSTYSTGETVATPDLVGTWTPDDGITVRRAVASDF